MIGKLRGPVALGYAPPLGQIAINLHATPRAQATTLRLHSDCCQHTAFEGGLGVAYPSEAPTFPTPTTSWAAGPGGSFPPRLGCEAAPACRPPRGNSPPGKLQNCPICEDVSETSNLHKHFHPQSPPRFARTRGITQRVYIYKWMRHYHA